jgi:hypothetical protein
MVGRKFSMLREITLLFILKLFSFTLYFLQKIFTKVPNPKIFAVGDF